MIVEMKDREINTPKIEKEKLGFFAQAKKEMKAYKRIKTEFKVEQKDKFEKEKHINASDVIRKSDKFNESSLRKKDKVNRVRRNKKKQTFFAQVKKEMQAYKRIKKEFQVEQKNKLEEGNYIKTSGTIRGNVETYGSSFRKKDKVIRVRRNKKKQIFFAQAKKEMQAYSRIKNEAKSFDRKMKEAEKAIKIIVDEETKNAEKEFGLDKKTQKKLNRKIKEAEKTIKIIVDEETRKSEKVFDINKQDKKIKETEKSIRIIADEKNRKKRFSRITEPNKKRNIFNRLGNIINLNQHEYDIYKDYINDYKKGKILKEDLELEWEEIQDYEDAKSDVKLRNAWRAFKLALVGAGLAATVHFGGKVLKSAYEWGYNFTTGFWDETKKDLKEQREEYEFKYGDTFPNGEKKKELMEEEYEQLNSVKQKNSTYISSIDAELTQDQDGNITVTLPNNVGEMPENITHEEDTKDLER